MLFSSCNESELTTDENNIESTLGAKGIHNLTTNFSSKSIEINELSTFYSKVENYGIYKDIETQQVLLEGTDFETLLHDFSSFYGINLSGYNLKGIVFYGNDVSINLTDFRNFTLITLDNNGYAKYVSYEKQGRSLVLVENNLQRHSFVMMNYFGYLGSKLSLDNNSMLSIINKKDFGLIVDPQINVNIQAQNIETTVINEYETIPYGLNGGHWCSIAECDSNSRGFCGPSDDGFIDCQLSSYVVDRECADEDADEYYNDKVIRPNGYKAAMYSIRDGFLMNTIKGKQYIDFYYKLSYCFEVLSLHKNESDSIAEVINKIRLKSLSFLLANDDDVIITNNDYVELKDNVNKFRQFSDNKEYQYILNVLEIDLDKFKNMTKDEIKMYFKD